MSKETRLRIASSREPFTVMNDRWQINEDTEGLFELSTRDGQTKLGPLSGEDLASALAVLSELERYLRERR